MRGSQADKALSRTRIVKEAARLAREQGLEGAGVGEVMRAAGMTHGGFYKHFDSKEAMLVEALNAAFAGVLDRMSKGASTRRTQGGPGFVEHYLSDEHVDGAGSGCPIPSLAAEVGRSPPALKEAFGAGVRRMIEELAAEEDGTEQERREAAARRLAMIAGAVMIARAGDRDTSRLVLEACRSKPASKRRV